MPIHVTGNLRHVNRLVLVFCLFVFEEDLKKKKDSVVQKVLIYLALFN